MSNFVTYLGSVNDSSIGVGTIVKGKEVRYHLNDCWEIYTDWIVDGKIVQQWIECYDVVSLSDDGSVESVNVGSDDY